MGKVWEMRLISKVQQNRAKARGLYHQLSTASEGLAGEGVYNSDRRKGSCARPIWGAKQATLLYPAIAVIPIPFTLSTPFTPGGPCTSATSFAASAMLMARR